MLTRVLPGRPRRARVGCRARLSVMMRHSPPNSGLGRRARASRTLLAGTLTALLAAGCGSSGTKVTGLSPAVKRLQASQAAYGRAHPGLYKCEADVWVMLIESYTDMQRGGQGILPAQAQQEYGAGSATADVYAQFYEDLVTYVVSHGAQGLQGGALQAVADVGERTPVPGPLIEAACLADLSPKPMAPAEPSTQQTGFAAALALWKQTASISAASGHSYLLQIAKDLEAAGDSSYATPIRALNELASMPPTGLTDAQMAEAQADVAALNQFFGTPGLVPNI